MTNAEWFWMGFSVSNLVWYVIFKWTRTGKKGETDR